MLFARFKASENNPYPFASLQLPLRRKARVTEYVLLLYSLPSPLLKFQLDAAGVAKTGEGSGFRTEELLIAFHSRHAHAVSPG